APLGARVNRQQLPSGLTLLALRNPAAPEIALEIDISAGAAVEPADKAGLATLVARLLPSGNATRNESQIAEAFEAAGATLAVDSDRGRARIRVRALAADLASLLPALRDVLAAPAFPK